MESLNISGIADNTGDINYEVGGGGHGTMHRLSELYVCMCEAAGCGRTVQSLYRRQVCRRHGTRVCCGGL